MRKNNAIFVPMNGETGSSVGPMGRLQTSRIRSAIQKCFSNIAEIKFSKGHYYCSAFVKFSDNNIVYLSTSDYRFFEQNFLVRSAKSIEDYTGGHNYNFVGFEKILSAIDMVKNFNDGNKFQVI